MTFRRLVLLAPLVFALHIAEEAPGFVAWTRLYPQVFSPTLSPTAFAITNAIYLSLVVGAAVLCASRSAYTLGLSAIAFLLSNAVFHIGATLLTGVYSPGTITAVALYVPLTTAALRCAHREGLLSAPRCSAALALGVVLANAPLRIMQRWI